MSLTVNDEEVKAINCMVAKLHNMSNAEGYDTYLLYSDGEIQVIKEDLYGKRAIFQSAAPIELPPVFTFPLTRGNYTYAIMKRDNCRNIRERMKKLLNN